MKTFDEYVGETVSFFGVNCNCFKLGNQVFEAIEDESDGYRSYLESVEVVQGNLVFPRSKLARVKVEEFEDGYFDGYRLVGVSDGHEWLRFGTDNIDDYYPGFIFDYSPKEA